MSATPFHFLRAITKDTIAALSGAASILLLFLGLWLPPNLFRDSVFILSGLSVLWAAYRVWADERNNLVALSGEYGQLQQSANEASTELQRAHGMNAGHTATIEALQTEIARLKTSPFDEELRAHADSAIASLTYMQRDFVRFLLLKGGTVRGDVVFLACTNQVGLDLNLLTRPAIERGLVNRTDDHITGYPTFTVNQSMSAVLKILLFPRKDKEGNAQPFFNGVV